MPLPAPPPPTHPPTHPLNKRSLHLQITEYSWMVMTITHNCWEVKKNAVLLNFLQLYRDPSTGPLLLSKPEDRIHGDEKDGKERWSGNHYYWGIEPLGMWKVGDRNLSYLSPGSAPDFVLGGLSKNGTKHAPLSDVAPTHPTLCDHASKLQLMNRQWVRLDTIFR